MPALLCACAVGQPIAPDLRRPAEIGPLLNTGYATGAQLVIASDEAWREAWGRLSASRRPVPPAPRIDFPREIVVIVAMGQVRSGGHEVRIVGVDRTSSGVVVHAVAISPGRGCITTANIAAPADLAVLPASAQPVAFDVRRETRNCD